MGEAERKIRRKKNDIRKKCFRKIGFAYGTA